MFIVSTFDFYNQKQITFKTPSHLNLFAYFHSQTVYSIYTHPFQPKHIPNINFVLKFSNKLAMSWSYTSVWHLNCLS